MVKLTTHGTSSASDIEKWRGGRGGKSNGLPCPVQMMKVCEKEVWRSECVVKLDRYSPFVLPFGLTVRQIV